MLLLPAVYLLGAPAFWRLIFPLPYQEQIFQNARAAELDPLLVAAVVRVESRYNPKAVSNRGAIGLMQLMPETAKWVAGQSGLPYQRDNLFHPEYNLRLGTWYLAYLLDKYEGDLLLALAAYNGGQGNVGKWLKKENWSGTEADLKKIPFPETRGFVRQVLRNYQIYRALYGDK